MVVVDTAKVDTEDTACEVVMVDTIEVVATEDMVALDMENMVKPLILSRH